MKKLFPFIFLFCFGCLSEKNTDPSTPTTFVRYLNGGFNDVAQDLKATADGGFIILATTEVRLNDVTDPGFKIKLIKTDQYGTIQWTQIYPPYDQDINNFEPIDSVNFRGRSIGILKDGTGAETGYIIVGDSIHMRPSSQSHIRVMLTDLQGNTTRAKNFKPAFAVQGVGVAQNSAGNFVVLGTATSAQVTNNMILIELDNSLNVVWSRSYGAGATSLANRLFIDSNSAIFWSGTVIKNNRADIRLVKTPPDSENTDFDLPIGDPTNNESGADICQYGFGFAVIGTTDEAGDDDILFKRLAQDGRELASRTLGFPGQSENGLAISQARDGGLILLGTVDTNVDFGRGGKDYYLIKINAFGETEWTQIFGSKNDDFGARVLTNADGSYTILGTTIFGGLRTLALIKTDKLGRIE